MNVLVKAVEISWLAGYSRATREGEMDLKVAKTRNPITVMLSETPEHAASLMSQHNFGALPVIHWGKVVCIATAKGPHDARAAATPRMGSAHPPLKEIALTVLKRKVAKCLARTD